MHSFNKIPQIAKQLEILNKSLVVVGFLVGKSDFHLLTIVRANEYGAHIVPKNGKWLTIPSPDCPKGKNGLPMRAREVQGLFRPKGKKILCVNKGGELVVYYYLRKEVTIPARPFIRTAFAENEKKYAKIIENGVKRIIYKDASAVTLLNQLGEVCANDIRISSIKWNKPSNAPITIANKGADNPLVDRGVLQKSIMYQVFLNEDKL